MAQGKQNVRVTCLKNIGWNSRFFQAMLSFQPSSLFLSLSCSAHALRFFYHHFSGGRSGKAEYEIRKHKSKRKTFKTKRTEKKHHLSPIFVVLCNRTQYPKIVVSLLALIDHGINTCRYLLLTDKDVFSCSQKKESRSHLAKKETEFLRLRRSRIGKEDFDSLKVVGRGAFGEVSKWAVCKKKILGKKLKHFSSHL